MWTPVCCKWNVISACGYYGYSWFENGILQRFKTLVQKVKSASNLCRNVLNTNKSHFQRCCTASATSCSSFSNKYMQTHLIVLIAGKGLSLYCEYFVRHLAKVAKPLIPCKGDMSNMSRLRLQGSAALWLAVRTPSICLYDDFDHVINHVIRYYKRP